MSSQQAQKVTEYHGHPNYFKVYIALVVLLFVSLGTDLIHMRGLALTILWATALVKAWLVAQNFMHLKYEPWVMKLIPISGVLCLIVFYLSVFPDAQLVQLNHELKLLPWK